MFFFFLFLTVMLHPRARPRCKERGSCCTRIYSPSASWGPWQFSTSCKSLVGVKWWNCKGVVKRITGLLLQIFIYLFFFLRKKKHFHFLLLSHTGQDPSGNTASYQERRCTHFILIWKLSGAVCRMIWIICHCGDQSLYQPAGSPDVALLQGDTLQLKCVSGRVHGDRDRIQKMPNSGHAHIRQLEGVADRGRAERRKTGGNK